jgi:hypothetical protein
MRPGFSISERAALYLLCVLVAFELCLFAGYLVFVMPGQPGWRARMLFDLDAEKNLPALFSAAQLLLVGIIFFAQAIRPIEQRFLSSPFLATVGLAFAFLSLDEAFSIHENITAAFKHLAWIPRFKGNHGIWVAPYLILCLLVFVVMRSEFFRVWTLHKRAAVIMLFGLLVFLSGAVGLEVVSYLFLRGDHSLQIFTIWK